METRRPPRPPEPRPFAAGLYSQKRPYLFQDFPDLIMLGQAVRCHIQVEGLYVSRVHAALELRDGARFLINKSDHGYTFIDGLRVDEPTPLRVGNLIVLGTTQLIATDAKGRFPIDNVDGVTDLYRKAIGLCGGQRAAERWLGCDHSAIRRRIERSQRQRKNRGS